VNPNCLIPLVATGWLASFSAMGASPSPISPARMSATAETLASDPFQGRAPGTSGEATTVAYLIHRFRALGLQPAGENGGWTQQVPSPAVMRVVSSINVSAETRDSLEPAAKRLTRFS
jgi:hypothetical protein